MKLDAFFIALLLMTLVCGGGCVGTSPLKPSLGWKSTWSQDTNKLPKAIVDDYEDYIRKLSSKERNGLGGIHLLEDGTGQRAVAIEVVLYGWTAVGTRWTHVLIYDKTNQRIKRVKYRSGHVMS